MLGSAYKAAEELVGRVCTLAAWTVVGWCRGFACIHDLWRGGGQPSQLVERARAHTQGEHREGGGAMEGLAKRQPRGAALYSLAVSEQNDEGEASAFLRIHLGREEGHSGWGKGEQEGREEAAREEERGGQLMR